MLAYAVNRQTMQTIQTRIPSITANKRRGSPSIESFPSLSTRQYLFNYRLWLIFEIYQVSSWNSIIIEKKKAIILGTITNLRSKIAHLNSFKRCASFLISDRHKEKLNSTVLPSFKNQPSANHCMIWKDTELSRPEFCCPNGWCMKNKFISLFVKGCSCFNSLNH